MRDLNVLERVPGGKAHMSWKLKGLERCAKHTEARTYPRANAIYFYGQFAWLGFDFHAPIALAQPLTRLSFPHPFSSHFSHFSTEGFIKVEPTKFNKKQRVGEDNCRNDLTFAQP